MRCLYAIATALVICCSSLHAEMRLFSPAFEHEKNLPVRFTCRGLNYSPPLRFENVPEDTKSLAIIMEDSNSTTSTFVHWLVWNIDPDITRMSERSGLGLHGRNDFGALGYRGPCPPSGKPHRYIFRLYALDTILKQPDGITRQKLDEAMKGHIIDSAELIGYYGLEN